MHALVVRFQVRPDRLADFDALVAQTVARIRAEEPGTEMYLTMIPADDSTARVFIEVYADEAAFVIHEEQSHTRHFLLERAPMLDSVRVERLHPSVG